MPDGCYLVNCTRARDGDRISAVAYYKEINIVGLPGYSVPGDVFGQQTTQPDDFVYLGDHGSFNTWETGEFQSVTFASGVTFSWRIQQDAQKSRIGQNVGEAKNDFKSFTVQVDNHGNLCANNDGYDCEKIYFCVGQ